MAPKPVDALTSFVFLTDNLPNWIQQIEDLSAYTAQKRNEFAAEYARLVNHVRPRKQKSPSLHSIHGSDDERPVSRDATSSKRSSLEISPLEAGNRHIFATARKRKTKHATSTVRSGASGPQKFRSRHMVVIQYDSHTQSSFETMVRNIGAARNNLRKGRQSKELAMAFDLPAFKPRVPLDDESPAFGGLNFKSPLRSSPLNPKASNLSTATTEELKTAAFDLADKDLEKAKDLCETAAHQFLRDGDCSVETKKLKEIFESVLGLAKQEAEKLRLEEEEEEKAAVEEAATRTDADRESAAMIKVASTELQSPAAADIVLGQDNSTIEVDDDNSSEIFVDLTAFRSTRANGRAAIRAPTMIR